MDFADDCSTSSALCENIAGARLEIEVGVPRNFALKPLANEVILGASPEMLNRSAASTMANIASLSVIHSLPCEENSMSSPSLSSNMSIESVFLRFVPRFLDFFCFRLSSRDILILSRSATRTPGDGATSLVGVR
jgi:hypothetical protein